METAKKSTSIAAGRGNPGGGDGVNAFEAEIVAVFVDLVVLLGMPKSMGEIYGLLFASAEPLAFADIERRLKLSKGSVSQGLKALRELGAIHEADGGGAGDAGARVSRWVAATELRQLIGSLLRERLTPYLERQDQRMGTAEAALAREAAQMDARDHRALESRLKKLQTWQSRGRAILPIVGRLL